MLEALHAEEPDDVDILNWLLTSLQEAGRHDEVLGYLRRWTELVSSGFAEGPAERVWRKLPPEHAPEVEQLVVGWLMQEPDQDARQLAMIAFLRGTGQHEAALSLARANEAVSESRGMYFQWEAYQALKAARRTDEAMAALTRLTGELGAGDMGASVASVQFQYELISLMLEAGRFDKARERINHWLQSARTEPERLMYLQMLTLCEQEAGRLEEAIQALELALELAPEVVGSHNELGYTLADLGREIERAGQLVRYAVSHEPRNSAFLDSLGWVKYKEEDYAAAVKWLRLSRYAGEGEDPTVCDHLGDAYWRLGNKEEARRFWNEAIQFARKRLEEAPQRLLYQQTLEAAQAKLAALERGETPQVAEPARKQ
jgi:tetratricopeptide (TPR) repeat protein